MRVSKAKFHHASQSFEPNCTHYVKRVEPENIFAKKRNRRLFLSPDLTASPNLCSKRSKKRLFSKLQKRVWKWVGKKVQSPCSPFNSSLKNPNTLKDNFSNHSVTLNFRIFTKRFWRLRERGRLWDRNQEWRYCRV